MRHPIARYSENSALLQSKDRIRFEEAEDRAVRSPTLGLSARYVVALLAVALFVVLGQVLIQLSLTRQEKDARIINVAGRQRMLSQKLAKSALAVLSPVPEHRGAEHAQTLAADLALWRRSHSGLTRGDETLGLSGQNSARTSRLLEELRPDFDAMNGAAERLIAALEGGAPREETERLATTILAHEGEFLRKMDELVFTYDREAKARVTELRRVEIALTAAALLVLALEALFIFRPAIRRLRRTLASLVAAKREYENLAQHDGLTGIANRRAFDGFLDRESRRAGRDGRPISVILVDVDHFKQYNETFGHLAGDECLQRVAGALRDQVRRPADMVARYGGDEFVAVLPDTDLAGAVNVANAMKEAVRFLGIEHAYPGIEEHVSVSIGVASGVPGRETRGGDALLSAADDALFRVKRSQRDAIATVLLDCGGAPRQSLARS